MTTFADSIGGKYILMGHHVFMWWHEIWPFVGFQVSLKDFQCSTWSPVIPSVDWKSLKLKQVTFQCKTPQNTDDRNLPWTWRPWVTNFVYGWWHYSTLILISHPWKELFLKRIIFTAELFQTFIKISPWLIHFHWKLPHQICNTGGKKSKEQCEKKNCVDYWKCQNLTTSENSLHIKLTNN